MAEPKKKSPRSFFLYLCIVILLLAGAVLLLPVYRHYQQKRSELSELRKDLAEKRTRSAELNAEAAELQSSPEAVEKVARERFGMAKEGEVLLTYPKDKEPAAVGGDGD